MVYPFLKLLNFPLIKEFKGVLSNVFYCYLFSTALNKKSIFSSDVITGLDLKILGVINIYCKVLLFYSAPSSRHICKLGPTPG